MAQQAQPDLALSLDLGAARGWELGLMAVVTQDSRCINSERWGNKNQPSLAKKFAARIGQLGARQTLLGKVETERAIAARCIGFCASIG